MNNHQLAFFIGAGASIFPPSCLPLADQLKTDIFKSLYSQFSKKIAAQEIAAIRDFPLEFLLQLIKDYWGSDAVKSCLKSLNSKYAGPIHHSIARLAHEGRCNVVFTVNFDILLEIALKLAKINYKVLSDIDVEPPPEVNEKCVYIYKLHGSIDDPKSLFATLDRVGEPISNSRKNAIIGALEERLLVFIGYRGADVDIKPFLKSELQCRTGRYIWNSLTVGGVDNEIYKSLDSNSFVLDDAVKFMRDLITNTFSLALPNLPHSPNASVSIVVNIMSHLGLTNYVEQLLNSKFKSERNDNVQHFKYLLELFRVEVRRGNWKRAKKYLEEVECNLNKLNGKYREKYEIILKYEQAKFLAGMNEEEGFKKLRELFKEWHQIGNDKELKWYRIVFLNLLLEYYPKTLKSKKIALECLNEAYTLAGTHVQLRSSVKRSEGILLRKTGLVKQSVQKLKEALSEIEIAADRNGLLVQYCELAKSLIESGEIDEAEEVMLTAKRKVEQLIQPNLIRQAEILELLGKIYNMKNDLHGARRYASKSSSLYKKIGAPLRARLL